jgi:CPA1 family monovalent cation:H+ antiporter
LTAVLLANLINRFLPSLSVPIVQMILGALFSIILFGAFGSDFEMEPELFFVLFLSPLVFQSTMKADKKTMGGMINPIVMAAVVLVFVTVVIVGYFTHFLIPSIPLAAAFALAGALGPTDVVAVEAVAHRVSLPRRLMSILSGESIINDATGIVCFQFAIAAAATGSFYIYQGVTSFLFLAVGGAAVGLLLTLLKYMLVKWLYSLDINNSSLHIAIGLMTPFIIYMISDKLGVSGILAVFFSGMAHSIFHDKFNPEVTRLNDAQENVWSVLSFSLDGLVFVMLGTQLPRILRIFFSGEHDIKEWQIVGYVLLISLALMLTRFVWWVLTARKKIYDDPENPTGRIKSGVIFSVAGARGAVPLACVMTIPLMLPDGTMFPQRDLIILTASGVIIISLLMTNFVLPLLAKQHTVTHSDMEQASCIEILHTVMKHLKSSETTENFAATEIVIRNYYSRMNQHLNSSWKTRRMHHKRKFLRNILLWEKDVFLHLAEMDQIDKSTVEHYLKEAGRVMTESGKKTNPLLTLAKMILHFFQSLTWKDVKQRGKNRIIADYNQSVHEVSINGFHLERELIQQMLETKRLSWKTAKEMQANITMLEAQLEAE